MASPEDDVLVVGGGPVGLATALYAARAGLRVSVVERRSGPVDKACGEGLMPGALTRLQDLGVDPPGAPIAGIAYLDRRHEVSAPFRHGPGRGVRRVALHDALTDAVLAAGIVVRTGTVMGVQQDRREVRVAMRDNGSDRVERSARYVVAADGLHSTLRTAVGLRAAPSHPRGGTRHGLRRHFRLAPWSSMVEVHWGRRAEAYVTPVAPDTVGIAVLTRTRLGYDDLLADFPVLTGRVADAEPASTVRGAGPLRQRSTARVRGRVLLVGDASGYVDALTGEGIALGLSQAEQAVRAVAADDPASYERGWRAVSRRPDALTAGLERLTRPRLARRAVVPLAAAVPAVFSAVVAQIASASGPHG